MPQIEVNAPRITVDPIPERPTRFHLTETVASTAGPDGERIEVMRSVTNPFMFILRGQKNEAEIDLNPFIQEALLHVLRANDYAAKPDPFMQELKMMERVDKTLEKVEKTSNHRIGVDLLGSGYAAVCYVDVTDDNGVYTDVQQTGIGRYKTRAEAVFEARSWSASDDIPLEEGFSDA